MAGIRDELNKYGAANDPAMTQSEYATKANPNRANEIVTEARQRLAANGGKASMLPAMIAKVSEEFAQRDSLGKSQRASGGYQQPNNMDAYIDRVLQMSGMSDAGPQAQSSVGNVGGSDINPGNYAVDEGSVVSGGDLPPVASDEVAPVEDNSESGDSFGMIAAGILAAGGAAALARYLSTLKGQVPDSGITDELVNNVERSSTDESIDAVDGDPSGQRAITQEQRLGLPAPAQQLAPPNAQLPPPPKQLPAPSAVDESIDAVEGTSVDQQFQDMVEGRAGSQTMPGANRFGDAAQQTSPDPAVAGVVDEAVSLAQSGDVRAGVNLLRENGIELDDGMLRQLVEGSNTFKTLKARAASGAVSGAVRGAVR